jgi:hypothetical protein
MAHRLPEPGLRVKWRDREWPEFGFCGLPPIEQKTLDGWGTVHLSRAGFAGGRLSQNLPEFPSV